MEGSRVEGSNYNGEVEADEAGHPWGRSEEDIIVGGHQAPWYGMVLCNMVGWTGCY